MIPIRLAPVGIHIRADRRLAFQVLTAFGASAQGHGASSRVLAREEGRLLVEFHTPIRSLFGRRSIYRTVEWVTPHEPTLVEFEAVEGPLAMMRDRLRLEEENGCTRLWYESEFGVRGWVAGWLIGMFYVRPLMMRFIREHLKEIRETIEARARKSRIYPQRPCGADDHALTLEDTIR